MDDLNKKALGIGKALASSPEALAAFQSIKPVLPNALIDRAASVELTQAMNEDAMLALTKALETVDPNMLTGFMQSMEEQVMQDVERMGAKLVELGFPDPRQDHDNWRIIAKMVGANPDGFMEDTFESAIAFHSLRELEKSQAKTAVASTSAMIIREAARAADLAHVKRMKEQNDAEEQSLVQDGAAKGTGKQKDKPTLDKHDVTKWVRKHWHKYNYRQSEAVRKYIEIHGGTFDQLYKIDLKNDLKKNPLLKPKKSD